MNEIHRSISIVFFFSILWTGILAWELDEATSRITQLEQHEVSAQMAQSKYEEFTSREFPAYR
jgi:hypothetical protein